jgi:hypothetical protein
MKYFENKNIILSKSHADNFYTKIIYYIIQKTNIMWE